MYIDFWAVRLVALPLLGLVNAFMVFSSQNTETFPKRSCFSSRREKIMKGSLDIILQNDQATGTEV
jgi:hypothetical protein